MFLWSVRAVVGGRLVIWSVFCIFTGRWSVFIFENGRCLNQYRSVVGGSWSVVCGWSVGGGFVLRRINVVLWCRNCSQCEQEPYPSYNLHSFLLICKDYLPKRGSVAISAPIKVFTLDSDRFHQQIPPNPPKPLV